MIEMFISRRSLILSLIVISSGMSRNSAWSQLPKSRIVLNLKPLISSQSQGITNAGIYYIISGILLERERIKDVQSGTELPSSQEIQKYLSELRIMLGKLGTKTLAKDLENVRSEIEKVSASNIEKLNAIISSWRNFYQVPSNFITDQDISLALASNAAIGRKSKSIAEIAPKKVSWLFWPFDRIFG